MVIVDQDMSAPVCTPVWVHPNNIEYHKFKEFLIILVCDTEGFLQSHLVKQ